MKIFQKVLVPIDFSSGYKTVVERAMAIVAQSESAEVHLISFTNMTIGNFMLAAEIGPLIDAQVFNNDLREITAKLEALKRSFNCSNNVTLFCNVLQGSYVSAISKYVLEHNINLVIVGTTGTEGIKEFIFGSDAVRIAASISCPVLTIQPFIKSTSIKKIILPIEDFFPVQKLHYGLALAKFFGAEIHLICLRENLYALTQKTFAIFFSIIEQLDIEKIPYKTFAGGGKNITDTILRYSEKENIDIILVNPGKESTLTGNYVEILGGNIVNHSRIPVLTIKK